MNLTCNKCKGKVFLDDTFDSLELFCIICGKRTFLTIHHPQYGLIKKAIYS